MNNIKVNVKKLTDDAILPSYGTPYAAGADLYSASETFSIEPGKTVLVHTGIAVEIPVDTLDLYTPEAVLQPKRGLRRQIRWEL
jgi:dUTP pyrophosphatase